MYVYFSVHKWALAQSGGGYPSLIWKTGIFSLPRGREHQVIMFLKNGSVLLLLL